MSLLATLITTLGPAVAQQLFANKSAKDLKADAASTISSAEDELAKMAAPQFGVSEHWKNYLQSAKQADKNIANRQEAAVGQAISDQMRYNPRAGGANVNALLNQLNRMPSNQNTLAAEQQLAGADQARQDAQNQFDMQRFMADRSYLQNLATGARQTEGQVDLQKRQSQADITSRLIETLGGIDWANLT